MNDLIAAGVFRHNGNFLFANHPLIIPYLIDEKIVYLRGRTLPHIENNGTSKYLGLVGKTAKRFFNQDQLKTINDSGELLLCEGEFDCMRAVQAGIPSIAIPGVNNFPTNGKDLLRKCDIYLCFDSDATGRRGMQEVTNRIGVATKGLYLKQHKDVTDSLCDAKVSYLLSPENVEQLELKPQKSYHSCIRLVSAREIQEAELPSMEWIIENLLTEGLTILAGKPKVGKSWLSMNLGLSITRGDRALHHFRVKKADVVYCALEDNHRRIQTRLNKILATNPNNIAPKGFYFLKENRDLPKLNEGGIEQLQMLLDDYPDIRLITIDTLGRCRADKGRRDNNIYLADYEMLAELQQFALTNKICVLVVHHTKKGKEDYVFDEISGTTGIAGSADALILLKKDGYNHTLYITGRDLSDAEYSLRFEDNTCTYTILEQQAATNLSPERDEIVTLIRESGRAMRTGEVANQLGKERSTVSRLLQRLHNDGILNRPQYGFYSLPKEGNDDIESNIEEAIYEII
jgi:predicted transcriptional regulator